MIPSDIRRTPPELVREIAALVGVEFTLDAAASPDNAVCPDYYALEEGRDGLELPWGEHTWVNPPYSEIGKWVGKAWVEYVIKEKTITMLVPANKTEQPWWQEGVEPALRRRGPGFQVFFLPGRRKFLMPDGSPIYAKNKDGSFKLNKKGEKIAGSPSFGLVVLHWS